MFVGKLNVGKFTNTVFVAGPNDNRTGHYTTWLQDMKRPGPDALGQLPIEIFHLYFHLLRFIVLPVAIHTPEDSRRCQILLAAFNS
jgi:hypothetical protein